MKLKEQDLELYETLSSLPKLPNRNLTEQEQLEVLLMISNRLGLVLAEEHLALYSSMFK